jgi:hypothetical protein
VNYPGITRFISQANRYAESSAMSAQIFRLPENAERRERILWLNELFKKKIERCPYSGGVVA